jgi:hypothetical protein
MSLRARTYWTPCAGPGAHSLSLTTRAHTHTHMSHTLYSVYTRTYTHARMYADIYVSMHACMHARTHTQARTHASTRTHSLTHTNGRRFRHRHRRGRLPHVRGGDGRRPAVLGEQQQRAAGHREHCGPVQPGGGGLRDRCAGNPFYPYNYTPGQSMQHTSAHHARTICMHSDEIQHVWCTWHHAQAWSDLGFSFRLVVHFGCGPRPRSLTLRFH